MPSCPTYIDLLGKGLVTGIKGHDLAGKNRWALFVKLDLFHLSEIVLLYTCELQSSHMILLDMA